MLYQAKSFLCIISFSFHNNPMRYCDAHFPKRKLKLSKFSFPLWNYMAKSEARTPVELCPRKCGWANLPSKPLWKDDLPKQLLHYHPKFSRFFLLEPAWPWRVKLCSRCCWNPCPHPLPSPLPCMLACLCLRLSVATNSHFARNTWELRSSREQLSV